MGKYFGLSYDRENIYLTKIKAKNREEANEIVDETISTNSSCDWTLNEEEFNKLVKEVNKVKK